LQTPVATKLLEEVSITLDELSSDEDDSLGFTLDELLSSEDDDSSDLRLEELLTDEEDDCSGLMLDELLTDEEDDSSGLMLDELLADEEDDCFGFLLEELSVFFKSVLLDEENISFCSDEEIPSETSTVLLFELSSPQDDSMNGTKNGIKKRRNINPLLTALVFCPCELCNLHELLHHQYLSKNLYEKD
jgi:hypothetical protein